MKFNQFAYSRDSYSNESKQEPQVVEKGHKNTLNIDLNQFEEYCKNFKEKKDVKILNLIGEDKEKFETVNSYIHMLYGTEFYKLLFEKVRKHFKNLQTKPGTVGGYFAGCLNGVKNNSQNNSQNSGSLDIKAGCGIGCAGSIPLPQEEEGWNFCDKAVILAEKNGTGYSFSFLKPSQNDEELDPAYLFVEGGTPQSFSGFSIEEKDYLRALGCNKVKLIGYNSSNSNNLTNDNVSYSEFYSEPKTLKDIKVRRNKKNHTSSSSRSRSHEEEEEENNYWWVWLLLIVFIIIILLCFACYKYKTSK